MAVNPNTNFTGGQVLTADQANRFPRGIMAISKATASDTTITILEEQLSVTFTAVANRNYRVTYFEPELSGPSGTYTILSVLLTSIAGAQLAAGYAYASAVNSFTSVTTTAIGTFTAGAVTIKAAAQLVGAGTAKAGRATTQPAYLMVEDIGPA